ncbi:Smr/MutS family protein [Nannocystaceae bacterium ST9]
MREAIGERARAGLDELVARCGAALELREREPGFEVVVVGGTPVRLTIGERTIEVEFAGWVESLALDDDEEEKDEAIALALDFVAAAVFGELRVTLGERGREVVQRKLEVRVDECWRLHGTRGRRGLAGLLGRVDTRVIGNRVARPSSLREPSPTGRPRAPWAGAGGFAWVPAGADAKPLVIDGELDLHDFPPREVGALVREYIEQCRARGIRDLRIVHGKGIGALRRTVHALLAEHPDVERWRLGGLGEGGWGATIVRLRA